MIAPRAILLLLLLILLAAIPGCTVGTPQNIDWATPVTDGVGAADEIQQTLDVYAAALVSKDREGFLSVIDQGTLDFLQQQALMFDRLAAVPFSQYQIRVTSRSEDGLGNVIAKVETAFTYAESFTALPEPDRSAFSLIRQDDGWKISGDATEQALGKPKEAGLEDFGTVKVLAGSRVIVMYLPGQESTAEQVARLTEAAFPRLEAVLPSARLPKVPVRLFASKEQIDLVFPGKWTEWTGGAARQLGQQADQGGEIIVDFQTFNRVSGYDPGYNPQMLAHELTHVALFPITGSRTPPFLLEGLADFVAGIEDATLLKQKLNRGERFSPTLRDLYHPAGFSALLSTEAATLAYEQSDTAVALLEKRYGKDRVLELLGEFKNRANEEIDQDALVDSVFRDVLGIGWDEFESEWLRYVMSS